MILERPILITKQKSIWAIRLYKRKYRRYKRIVVKKAYKGFKIIYRVMSVGKERFKIIGIVTIVKEKNRGLMQTLTAKIEKILPPKSMFMQPRISIIIPTLNEEKNLTALLKSIKQQRYPEYEVIVADYNSKDRTRELAERYNCRIARGGRPAKGRNEGVKLAKNGILIFLDSDTFLKKDFLKDNINEFVKRDLDIAICYMRFSKTSISLKITERFCNFGIRIISKLYGVGTGFCIICKRELHDKIKGFNEDIHILEDMDYVRRAIRSGARYGILRSHCIILSPRRYIKDGPFKLTAKYTYAFFRGLIKGPMKEKKVEYEWAKYDD